MGYAAGPPYDLVAGDAYAVFPFGNTVVTRTVTGAQLWLLLEHSVGTLPMSFGGFAQISGFQFTYRASAPVNMRVQSVTLDDGTMIARDSTTRITFATSDFTNAGGDGYSVLVDGMGTSREVMADVFLDYIRMNTPLTPMTHGRITAVP